MTMGQRVQLPSTTEYPVTLSNIGGDPRRSRKLAKGKTRTYEAADEHELRALLALGGQVVDADPDEPEGPATPENPTP